MPRPLLDWLWREFGLHLENVLERRAAKGLDSVGLMAALQRAPAQDFLDFARARLAENYPVEIAPTTGGFALRLADGTDVLLGAVDEAEATPPGALPDPGAVSGSVQSVRSRAADPGPVVVHGTTGERRT